MGTVSGQKYRTNGEIFRQIVLFNEEAAESFLVNGLRIKGESRIVYIKNDDLKSRAFRSFGQRKNGVA